MSRVPASVAAPKTTRRSPLAGSRKILLASYRDVVGTPAPHRQCLGGVPLKDSPVRPTGLQSGGDVPEYGAELGRHDTLRAAQVPIAE